jgi:hypothetical protein
MCSESSTLQWDEAHTSTVNHQLLCPRAQRERIEFQRDAQGVVYEHSPLTPAGETECQHLDYCGASATLLRAPPHTDLLSLCTDCAGFLVQPGTSVGASCTYASNCLLCMAGAVFEQDSRLTFTLTMQ